MPRTSQTASRRAPTPTRCSNSFASRRRDAVTRLVVAIACLVGLLAPAAAQDYPSRPIRIVVSFGPGGGADIVGRILGQSLSEKLGQPAIIENRPGAAGTIGNEGVAPAA